MSSDFTQRRKDAKQETQRSRLAILISGHGSNMVALAEAVREGRVPNAEIAVVISDQPNAAGLTKAKEHGIETLVIGRRG
ncbi:MAG TPA: formyltransferase family protein, partial [Pyrinomonadaceae bacterium]|nr:formyltransferase family protein [Pyrinomonadaceae bacterium]